MLTPTGAARFGVTLLLTLAAVLIALGFTVVYVAQQQKHMCGLIVVMDDSYREQPPATDAGRHLAAEVSKYRDKIGC
ncbi:MAG: hypothetical protein ACJ72N_27465 [Labedaea sp.]|jgi:hypothetical protein